MAAFDGTIPYSGGTYDFQALGSILTGKLPVAALGVAWSSTAGSPVIQTSSTSLTPTGRSLSVACEADELLVVYAHMNVSPGILGAGAVLQLRLDGVYYNLFSAMVGANASVYGDQGNNSILWCFSGLSGTHSIDLYWANFNTAATIYSADQYIVTLRFKYRSASFS